MFGKNCFILMLMLFTSEFLSAQNFDLEEKKPVTENGFEYGYNIKNEQVKEAKGEEYSRFELTFYITNNSGCTKLYEQRNGGFDSDPNLLAIFNCNNANGKRFTSKSGKIVAKDFYLTVKRKVNDKETSETVKAGFIFRSGETLRSNIIVLIPKGERPVIQCSVNNPVELR